jgi:outer membrane receptor protein involved in Fe transport
VRISTGYRPGGPNLVTPGLPADFPAIYGPDSTTNYEIGFRKVFFDNTFTVDTSLYYIDWSHVQITSLICVNSGCYAVDGNAGGAVSKGVEWNLDWTPLRGLNIGIVGAYTDAYLTASAPELGASKGDLLPYVPNWSNTVNVDYNWDLFADYQGFVGGTWTYLGVRDTDFSPSSIVEPHVRLPAYSQLNLQLGVRKGNYMLELYSKNVTESHGIAYFASSGGVDNSGNLTGVASVIQPRTIGIRLSADF